MMLHFLLWTLSCLLCSTSMAGEGPIEFLNRKASQMISGNDCSETTVGLLSDPACETSKSGKPSDRLANLTEDIFYNELATLEMERLECAVSQAKSVASQELVAQKSLDRLNETLPYLDEIRQEIFSLTNENQILRGKIGSFENTNSALKINPEKQKRIDEYNSRNELLKKKVIEYERRMAEIPGVEIPGVRSLIEGRMSGPFSKLSLFSPQDFKKMGQTAISRMQSSIEVLKNSKGKAEYYKLDRNLKVRLAKDEELMASLMAKHPNAAADIHRFQCRAEQRDKGGDLLTIGTLALPVGGFGLAKLARMRAVLATPMIAKTAAQGSKVLGYSATAMGTSIGFQELIDLCLRPSAGFTNNKCEVTLKSMAEEHSQFDCYSNLVLNSAGGAGGIYAAVKGQKAEALSEFVKKIKGKTQDRDLAGASGLDNSERVDTAQVLVGRNLNESEKKALNEAHNIGDGFGSYKRTDIAKKSEILRQGGFSREERKTLLWKGIAGNESDDLKKSWESVQKWSPSGNKDMNLAILRSKMYGDEDSEALKLWKSSTDQYLVNVSKKSPSIISERDYWDISHAASFWGSRTKDPTEKALAKSTLISAYKKELDMIDASERAKGQKFDRQKHTLELIDFIKKGPGKGASADASNFKVEALEDFLGSPEKWENKNLLKSLPPDVSKKAENSAVPLTSAQSPNDQAFVIKSKSSEKSQTSTQLAPPTLKKEYGESPQGFELRNKNATALQNWLGRPFNSDRVSADMTHKPDQFAKKLNDLRTHDDLRSAGLNDYEISLLRLSGGKPNPDLQPVNDFESSRYFADYRKQESENPFLKEQVFNSEKEAAEALSKHASKSGTLPQIKEAQSKYIYEEIKSMVETQRKVQSQIMQAKNSQEAHNAMARFKLNGIECRNLYQAAEKLGVNVIRLNPQWSIQKNYERYCK